MLEGSILQQLTSERQRQKSGRSPLDYGVYYKNTLVALCHALEDCILESDSEPNVIAAFQRGKWYLQEADRYGDLAKKCDRIAILASPETGFREHPTSQLENVSLVSLESDDPVSVEWHLIVFSPAYTAMVLCQELADEEYGPAGPPKADLERKFYGFWTFEPQQVLEAAELLCETVARYDGGLAGALQQRIRDTRNALPEGTDGRDDLNSVVSRVVKYLRETHQSALGREVEVYSPYTKALDRNLISNELQAYVRMAQFIDLCDLKNPMAAAEVATLTEMMAQLLDLPAWQIKRLRLAALFHRLDEMHEKLADETIPENQVKDRTSEPGTDAAPYCNLVPAAQIMRKMPQLRAIATIVNHQNEWWNGSGAPGRLSHDAIPLESRILGLVAEFQARLNEYKHLPRADALNKALETCRAQQGDRWDPKLIETLTLLVMGMQQGLSLPSELPKASAGMWLIDSPSEPSAAQI